MGGSSEGCYTRAAIKNQMIMERETVKLVALTEMIGLYPAAALYIGLYMRWIGKHRWLLVLAISLGVPLCSYIIFDKWFLIPMPKGWWGVHLRL